MLSTKTSFTKTNVRIRERIVIAAIIEFFNPYRKRTEFSETPLARAALTKFESRISTIDELITRVKNPYRDKAIARLGSNACSNRLRKAGQSPSIAASNSGIPVIVVGRFRLEAIGPDVGRTGISVAKTSNRTSGIRKGGAEVLAI